MLETKSTEYIDLDYIKMDEMVVIIGAHVFNPFSKTYLRLYRNNEKKPILQAECKKGSTNVKSPIIECIGFPKVELVEKTKTPWWNLWRSYDEKVIDKL
jgi:hypothetical protein